MNEIIVPIAIVALMVVALSLTLRLFATWMLNRTIREALRSDPASVKLLIAKLETGQPWADALLGWILIAFSAGLAILSLFEDVGERRDILQGAMVPALVGITVLLFVHFAGRANAASRKG